MYLFKMNLLWTTASQSSRRTAERTKQTTKIQKKNKKKVKDKISEYESSEMWSALAELFNPGLKISYISLLQSSWFARMIR